MIYPYDDSMAEAWDAFVQEAPSGTILHTRRFLSYHQDRFEDCSLIVCDEKGQLLAVFPAAFMPSDKSVVMSHPGISFGGILGSELCRGETMVLLMAEIGGYYGERGVSRLLYKPVPYFYHRMPVQDDLYALSRMGAIRYRCDLTSTIDLQNRGRIGSRRKRGYKKAQRNGVCIASGAQYAGRLWDVLSENLVKHGVKPVHSLDEIIVLHERFPEEIRFIVALYNNQVEAGVVLFHSPMVVHAQYIASSAEGYSVNALDMIFEHCIESAANCGARYFDFGNSNEDAGKVLNTGLYVFKSEFGAGGCVHEFYEIDLENINAS